MASRRTVIQLVDQYRIAESGTVRRGGQIGRRRAASSPGGSDRRSSAPTSASRLGDPARLRGRWTGAAAIHQRGLCDPVRHAPEPVRRTGVVPLDNDKTAVSAIACLSPLSVLHHKPTFAVGVFFWLELLASIAKSRPGSPALAQAAAGTLSSIALARRGLAGCATADGTTRSPTRRNAHAHSIQTTEAIGVKIRTAVPPAPSARTHMTTTAARDHAVVM